jgi:phage virion morphogenesis protein
MLSLRFNANQVRNYLNKLIRKFQNLTPELHKVGQFMVASTDENFQKEQSPYGEKWEHLAPSTLKYKASRGFIMQILQRQGLLRSSIRYRIEKGRVEVGSPLPYASYLQEGTKKMPKRQFLGVSQRDRREIIAILKGSLR